MMLMMMATPPRKLSVNQFTRRCEFVAQINRQTDKKQRDPEVERYHLFSGSLHRSDAAQYLTSAA